MPGTLRASSIARRWVSMELALPESTTTPALTDWTEIELLASDLSSLQGLLDLLLQIRIRRLDGLLLALGTTWRRLRISLTPEISRTVLSAFAFSSAEATLPCRVT